MVVRPVASQVTRLIAGRDVLVAESLAPKSVRRDWYADVRPRGLVRRPEFPWAAQRETCPNAVPASTSPPDVV